jgi:hypothetical protein
MWSVSCQYTAARLGSCRGGSFTPLQVQRGALDAGSEGRTGASNVDETAWVLAPRVDDHVVNTECADTTIHP